MLSYTHVVDFCVKHKISIEAFFLAYLLYLDTKLVGGNLIDHRPSKVGEHARPLSQVYKYSEMAQKWDTQAIEQLLERGFVKETPADFELEHRRLGGTPRYYPDYLTVTPKFADAVMATPASFQEFWDEYPAFIPGFTNPRDTIPVRAVDRDELEKLYYKRIQTRIQHEDLMRALRWAKENQEIKTNIRNYIDGDLWKGHLEMMREGVVLGGGSTLINE